MAAQSLGVHMASDETSAGRRRQVLVAVVTVLVVVSVALLAGVSQYAGAKHDLVAELETGADRFDAVFREAVESRLQSLRLAAEILARDDGVAGALANRDRSELGQQTVGFYNDTLKPRFALSILGFQTPDGIMFFRAHRPQLLGDDASGRTAVATVLKSRVSIAGIELGRTGPELRALTPVIVHDTLAGSVEVGSGIFSRFRSQAGPRDSISASRSTRRPRRRSIAPMTHAPTSRGVARSTSPSPVRKRA